LGVSAVGIGSGAWFLSRASKDSERADAAFQRCLAENLPGDPAPDSCKSESPSHPAALDAHEDEGRARTLAVVSFSTAGAALIGAGLLLWASGSEPDETALLPWLGPGQIGMQGHFVTPSFNLGDLCALASMALWGAYTVFLRLRRDALGMVEYLTLVCLLGLGYMAPWVLAELALGATLRLSGAGVAAVLYSAFGSLLLAYAGWSYVVTRLGAARAGVTMHLMPAISVVLAAVFLGERPYWYHFAGVALVLAGVALASMRARAAA